MKHCAFLTPFSDLSRAIKWRWCPSKTLTLAYRNSDGHFGRPYFDFVMKAREPLRSLLEHHIGEFKKDWDWQHRTRFFITLPFREIVTIKVFGKRSKFLTFLMLDISSKIVDIEIIK